MFARSSATRALRRLVVTTVPRSFSSAMRTPAVTNRTPRAPSKTTLRPRGTGPAPPLVSRTALVRGLSSAPEAEASPYAAEFSSLLRHLQTNRGDVDDAYWKEHVLNAEDTSPERLRYLAGRLRDSIAVPEAVRPRALGLWERALRSPRLGPVGRAETHAEVAVFLQRHGDDSGEADGVVSHLQRAVDIYRVEVDSGNEDVTAALAAAYMHLALVHQQNRAWTDSLAAFEKGVQGQIAVLGENHGAVADTYQNMGHLHGQLQQFDGAVESYRRALEIYRRVDGDQQASVAGAYHNIGMALQYQAQVEGDGDQQALGRFIEEALEAMQRALRIRHAALGSHHVDTAASHMALAQFLSQLRQPQSADEHYRAAADIWQGLVDGASQSPNQDGVSPDGSDGPPKMSPQQLLTARRHLATVYNNKGATQHGAGKGQAALEDYTKAQQALQPMFEGTAEQQGVPPSLMLEWAATNNNIGMAHLQLQAPEKAMEAHQTAQAVLEQSVAQHSSLLPHLRPSLAQTYGSIGKVYQAQHDFEAALAALEQAHQCLEVLYANQPHADLASSHNNLGLVHTQLQNYEQALASYKAAQTLFAQTMGAQHPHTGSCVLNTGLTLAQQGKIDEASKAFAAARDIWAASLGPGHEQTQMAQRYSNDPASALQT